MIKIISSFILKYYICFCCKITHCIGFVWWCNCQMDEGLMWLSNVPLTLRFHYSSAKLNSARLSQCLLSCVHIVRRKDCLAFTEPRIESVRYESYLEEVPARIWLWFMAGWLARIINAWKSQRDPFQESEENHIFYALMGGRVWRRWATGHRNSHVQELETRALH